MTREDIVRLWDEANNLGIPIKSEFAKELERFAAIFEAAERDRRAFELAECYRCGWDSGVKAERDACANVAETFGVHPALNVFGGGPEWYKHAKDIAAAIRARGKK